MGARENAKGFWIPAALLVVGCLILFLRFLLPYLEEPSSWRIGDFVAQGVGLAVGLFVAIEALLLLAPLADTFLGRRGSAILKVAGIFTFTVAVAGFVPCPGGLTVSLVLYFGLLKWLLPINLLEALLYAGVLGLVRLLAVFLAATIPLLSLL